MLFFLFLFAIAFILYKLSKRYSKNNSTYRDLEEEKDLKNFLNRIYSSDSLEDLKDLFSEAVRCHPKYHDLFDVAMKEKIQDITQNPSLPSFEVKKSKVRKRWKLAFFLNILFNWSIFVVVILLQEIPKEPPTEYIIISSIFLFTIVLGIPAWITYRNAYQKQGTFVLSMVLILFPLIRIHEYIKQGFNLSFWYLIVFDLALFGFYWLSSFRLRQVNQETKIRMQLANLRGKASV